MNDQSLNQNDKPVKPCVRCGAIDRYTDGECRPCARAAAKKRYNENNDAELKRKRVWRQNNPDYGRNWHINNIDKHKKQCRDWHVNNADKSKESRTNWKQNNKEKLRAHSHNRRAKLKSGGKLSSNIMDILMDRQKGKCACCGNSLNGEYHIDHIMPLALGGTNTDDNVQLLLPKCNMSKGAKHPIDYMREKGKLL